MIRINSRYFKNNRTNYWPRKYSLSANPRIYVVSTQMTSQITELSGLCLNLYKTELRAVCVEMGGPACLIQFFLFKLNQSHRLTWLRSHSMCLLEQASSY